MSEPKFTRGPWHNPQAEWVADSAENAICPMAAGKPISECEANAALIAAAPEMYECICDALTDLQMSDGMKAHFQAVQKKARGE